MTFSGNTYWGVEMPILSPPTGCNWSCLSALYSASVLSDIANNLHANYIRTQWSDGQFNLGAQKYYNNVDPIISRVCGHGLGTLLIIGGPSPINQSTIAAYKSDVQSFLSHEQTANPGCISWIEIGNEPNLDQDPFDANVANYAEVYEAFAPMIGEGFGIPVITGGTSGYKSGYCGTSPPPNEEICGKYWTDFLSHDLAGMQLPLFCYGFHPYDAFGPPVDMTDAMQMMNNAPVGLPGNICVTEIGSPSSSALNSTLTQLNGITPLVTVYEYEPQGPNDNSNLILVQSNGTHTPLYAVVKQIFTTDAPPAGPLLKLTHLKPEHGVR